MGGDQAQHKQKTQSEPPRCIMRGKNCILQAFGADWLAPRLRHRWLGQVVWQEGLSHCYNIGREHCNLQCFGANRLARKLQPLRQYRVENSVIYCVLEQFVWQEGLNHYFNMGGKHCNFQCFGTILSARKLEPLLQHGKKTL